MHGAEPRECEKLMKIEIANIQLSEEETFRIGPDGSSIPELFC